MRYGANECMYCGSPLYEGRYDRYFCNKRCAAAWHRARTPDGAHERKTPGQIHEEKGRETEKRCEWCDSVFAYNAYAERGGERVPQYCSNKCRQAAYRARKKGQDTKNGRNQGANNGGQKRQQQYDFDRRPQKPDWWSTLGVPNTASWDAITKAWKRLVVINHPDRNRDNEAAANERLKDINEAYQELKKRYGKNVKQARQ